MFDALDYVVQNQYGEFHTLGIYPLAYPYLHQPVDNLRVTGQNTPVIMAPVKAPADFLLLSH